MIAIDVDDKLTNILMIITIKNYNNGTVDDLDNNDCVCAFGSILGEYFPALKYLSVYVLHAGDINAVQNTLQYSVSSSLVQSVCDKIL